MVFMLRSQTTHHLLRRKKRPVKAEVCCHSFSFGKAGGVHIRGFRPACQQTPRPTPDDSKHIKCTCIAFVSFLCPSVAFPAIKFHFPPPRIKILESIRSSG